MRKNRQDRFKVSADIRNIVVDSSESAIKVKLINSSNDTEWRPPVAKLTLKKGRLDIARRNAKKKAPESDQFELAKAEVTKALLTKNGSAIDLQVMDDDESIACISIGRGTISIGRSKSTLVKYKWDMLHRILGYGHKVAKELRGQKSGIIKLLILNTTNCVVSESQVADKEIDLPNNKRKFRPNRLLLLNPKNRVIQMGKLD
jgi:hypothetical protein